ncbi:UDP-N-acetylmuramoyl-L-alanine--D-glutamate ligase [Anaeromyxobacter sp. Fw109-5]|uniref:UDP-N-acetylmuramoyl-L-alanine--D-glutamate ligase n=1 Tax=Anaeromyxobacter sp. (strain Fw109-5) TaxID=404589 RepID=UPI0000ED6D87|nr:UDP-N-acetylmuramoyl-L-alanine--D-glutamate ligase [Anaeromyxobacter sp. Fw109-5]ABS28061.1 UDP-N-acetylmuramoylalanine--D-glutamate ligase [Anaeromyxobacter sp. Fw109-5]
MTPQLKGKRVTVVGLARSGVAAARLCAREGARVTVTDRRAEEHLTGPLAALETAGVRRVLGGHDAEDFTRADLVVVSPGVPMALAEVVRARAAGVPVWGEVELAARFLAGVPIVAITGTNGKSTTTALAGALFARHRRTFTGGNLGTPLCQHVLDGGGAEVVVAELSSFQMEGLLSLRPRVAAILNVTPDHLDRYRDVDDYAAAKARLFGLQQPGDHAVANARDPRALAMAEASRAVLHTFGFGPPGPGARDPGLEPDEGGATELWVQARGGGPERFRLANRALRGRHNRENAMAAVLCARLLGVPGGEVQAGLDAFGGLPHRLEVVGERGGIEWVNDSKATNVDSTLVGLSAFPAGTARVVLVMGGRGKGAPYAPLRPLFAGRVKALLTIGEDAPAVERELGDLCPTEACVTLEAAVRRAAALVRPGDAVLLSPACASYDQFRNYEERGEAFRRHVAEFA